MDMATTVVGGLYVAIILAGLYWAGIWLLCRISPKFAAKRKLRDDTKFDRGVAKRRKRRESREGRLTEWVENNPDDPTARALLAKKAAPSPISVPTVEKESDPQAVLHQRQQEADDFQARMEARKVAEALLAQQLLEWALAHPETPEGRRHLEELMVEASKQIEDADRDIYIASFAAEREDSPEAIAAVTRISEAEGRKEAAVRMIRKIQAVVTSFDSNPQ